MNKEYEAFLQSDEWKSKREEILRRDGYRCFICGSEKDLCVHHETYNFGWMPPNEWLTTLCRNCHRDFHKISEAIAGIFAKEFDNTMWRVDEMIKSFAARYKKLVFSTADKYFFVRDKHYFGTEDLLGKRGNEYIVKRWIQYMFKRRFSLDTPHWEQESLRRNLMYCLCETMNKALLHDITDEADFTGLVPKRYQTLYRIKPKKYMLVRKIRGVWRLTAVVNNWESAIEKRERYQADKTVDSVAIVYVRGKANE